MAIYDKTLEFTDSFEVIGSGVIGNGIDNGAAGQAYKDIFITAKVEKAFTGLDSLKLII